MGEGEEGTLSPNPLARNAIVSDLQHTLCVAFFSPKPPVWVRWKTALAYTSARSARRGQKQQKISPLARTIEFAKYQTA